MTFPRRRRRMAAGLLVCGLTVSACGGDDRSSAEAGDCPRDASSGVVRSCARVAINSKRFQSVGDRVKLSLPDGSVVEVTPLETQTFEGKGVVWHGTIIGKKFSDVTIATVGKTVVGTIAFDGHMYRLRPIPGGITVIEELDSTSFLNDAPTGAGQTDEPEVEPPTASCTPGSDDCQPVAAQCADDDPDIVDVLVIYTTRAAAALNGEEALNAWTILQVFEANRSYKLSKLTHQIRLVSVQKTNYQEFSNSTTLDDLIGDLDPQFSAHPLRNASNADVVVMLTHALVASSAGSAKTFTAENLPPSASFSTSFEPYAYAVVDALGFETTDLVFAHEIGHLMGAEHDASANPIEGVIPLQSRGYFDPSPGAGCNSFMTIMAVRQAVSQSGAAGSTGPDRLAMWSSPDLQQCGRPVGSATAKNRDSLAATAPFISKFRCGLPSPGDVWMKDSWNDSGAEPDPGQASADMWKSPYIWVRNSKDVGPSFPAQHLHQSPVAGQVNFVYAKLQNDGAQAEGKVEFWVANTATTLIWPGSFALIGAVTVPDLPAHSTLIVPPLEWTPSGAGPYSFLARWVSGSDPIPSPEPSGVDAYVRGSNNVVWRSLSVLTLAPGDESAPLDVGIDNLVQNRSVNSLVIKPSDANPAHSFFRHGEIVVQLDDGLLRAWERTGYQGRGFERSGHTLRITDPNGAILDGLVLDPGDSTKLQLQFRVARDQRLRGKFHVDVVQQQLDEIGTRRPIGGVGFEVQVSNKH